MRKPALPYLAFAGCCSIWGSTFLVIRIGNDALPPIFACSLRMLLAFVLLSLVLVVTRQSWPRGAAFKAAFWYGVWEFGLCMPLLYIGEKTLSSGLSAVLYATCPIAAMFEARLLGMERLNAKKVGAAVLALLGVAIIFWRELTFGSSTLGMLAVFGGALFAPLAGLSLQKGPTQNPIASNAVGSLVGLVVCLPASFAFGEKPFLPHTWAQVLPVAYLAIAGSMGAFVMLAWLLNHWKTTTAAFIGVVIPIIAVVLGWLVRGEALAPGSVVGAAIVLVGVVIALRSEAAMTQQADAKAA